MPKIEAMYDGISAHAGTVTALTFFYEGEPGEPNIDFAGLKRENPARCRRNRRPAGS
jgi:hypothetical protein